MRLSRGEVTGATRYDVRLDGGASTTLTATAYTFSGLSANRGCRLEVRVQGLGRFRLKRGSRTHSAVQAAPSGHLRVAATITSLRLSWSGASGATGYQVQLNGSTKQTYDGTGRSHTFSGHNADSEYTLVVPATNCGGASAWATTKRKTKPTSLSLTTSVTPSSSETGE